MQTTNFWPLKLLLLVTSLAGSTSLLLAAETGHVDVVRTLLEASADTELKNARAICIGST